MPREQSDQPRQQFCPTKEIRELVETVETVDPNMTWWQPAGGVSGLAIAMRRWSQASSVYAFGQEEVEERSMARYVGTGPALGKLRLFP